MNQLIIAFRLLQESDQTGIPENHKIFLMNLSAGWLQNNFDFNMFSFCGIGKEDIKENKAKMILMNLKNINIVIHIAK